MGFSILRGGHFIPISILGDRELFRCIQKREMNKNTSDVMNKMNLNLIKYIEFLECSPIRIFSFLVMLHHLFTVSVDIINIIFINIFLEFGSLMILGILIKIAFIMDEAMIGIFLSFTK